MRIFRISLMIFAIAIIIGLLFAFDYSNPSWSENTGSYLGIISMMLLILLLIISLRHERKHKN